MKIYELTFILNPNLDEKGIQAEVDKITSQIKSTGGEILDIEQLGSKRMTVEIAGQRQGIYMTIYYKAPSGVPRQLDGIMKLDESILRSLTLVLKPTEYKSPAKDADKPVETVADDSENL
jgi:small subunit ribosomal protein S6